MKKIEIKVITSILLILLVFLIPCSALANTKDITGATKGFIWEATKGKDSIYLAGTMHPAPNNVDFFNDNINNIIKKTDGLAVEVNLINQENVKELKDYMTNSMYLKNGEIKNLLVGDEEKILHNILVDYDIKYNDIKNLNPNGLMLTLSSKSYALNGFIGPAFDLLLQEKYKELNKEIISLESVKEQMDVINTDKDSLQKYIDQYNINAQKEEKEYMNELFEGYKNGDYSIGEKAIKKQQESLETYKKLIVDRNIKMADKVEKLSMSGKKYLVAVGYLHYFGDDGLIKLLEEKGYSVKPIN